MRRLIVTTLVALLAAGVVVRHRNDPTPAQQRPTSGESRQATLGREIFRDPTISDDGKTSCASCHVPAKNYSDSKPVSVGVFGRTGTRNAPSLAQLSAIRSEAFFWDGRRQTLNQAVLDPMTNPVEMGLHDLSQLVRRVQSNPHYASSFDEIFRDANLSVSEGHIAEVLTAFIRSMPITESAYDRSIKRGDMTPLDPRAKLGLDLFSGKAHCTECHSLRGTPAALTDNEYHRGGVGMESVQQDLAALTASVIQRSLRGADIGDRVATHADEAQLGRFNVTLDPADIGLFRTPSLRDVSKTSPYMHDGSIATLEEAIDREVYYRGLQDGHPLNLSVEDRRDLKAFLEDL